MTRKSRRIAELQTRVSNLDFSLTWTRLERDVYKIRSRRYALRIARLARAVWRLRRELAEQKRVNDRLADQLFNAMGYTDAGLKALGVPAHTAAGREPGEVAS
ncbi:hypothetical protein [Streptomyces sp. NPDC048196]|uniref:hypothetical protein n=1 Tax=Streptomyces sp. NPDC048196 TaxID=3154712 RepID=UPI0033D5D625